MPARALTALVIVMGVLIVAGFTALAMMIAGRAHKAPVEAAARLPGFVAAPIELPKGAHVAALSAGTNRAVVDVALPDGSQELVVIDLASGRRLGTIALKTAP